MSILAVIRVAIGALGSNRLRTGLTMLGMIIGVAAVITMLALGSGAQSSLDAQIRAAGTNLIIVTAGNFSMGGVRHGQGAATTLTVADAEAVRRDVAGVQYLTPGVTSRAQVIVGNQNWSTPVQGTDVDWPAIRSWPVREGSFFSPQDVRSAAKVAVLGSVVRDMLFGGGADPVGESIRIGKQPFKVIGVMGSKGQGGMGQDQDDIVFVPYTTVQKKLAGITHINNMTVSAASSDQVSDVAEDISEVLRVQHQLAEGVPDDFMVRTLEEMTSVRSEMTRTMTALLAGIAGVSLLVGGIGIMNIMLVSVTERTKEIGLRRAVGARRADVMLQFLVEAIVLSVLGGLVGIGVGYSLSEGITVVLQWPTTVPANAILLAFGFSAAIGIFFGFYPARKASRLDPIDALRYE